MPTDGVDNGAVIDRGQVERAATPDRPYNYDISSAEFLRSLEGLVPRTNPFRTQVMAMRERTPTVTTWPNLPGNANVAYRFKVETRGGFLLRFCTTKLMAKEIRDRYNRTGEDDDIQRMRPIASMAEVKRGLDHPKGETGATRWGRVSGPGDQGVRFAQVAL